MFQRNGFVVLGCDAATVVVDFNGIEALVFEADFCEGEVLC